VITEGEKMDEIVMRDIKTFKIIKVQGNFTTGKSIICPMCKNDYSKQHFPTHLKRAHRMFLLEIRVKENDVPTIDKYMEK
jgi:hypothetical protein